MKNSYLNIVTKLRRHRGYEMLHTTVLEAQVHADIILERWLNLNSTGRSILCTKKHLCTYVTTRNINRISNSHYTCIQCHSDIHWCRTWQSVCLQVSATVCNGTHAKSCFMKENPKRSFECILSERLTVWTLTAKSEHRHRCALAACSCSTHNTAGDMKSHKMCQKKC